MILWQLGIKNRENRGTSGVQVKKAYQCGPSLKDQLGNESTGYVFWMCVPFGAHDNTSTYSDSVWRTGVSEAL